MGMTITSLGTQVATTSPVPLTVVGKAALDPPPDPADVTPGWENSLVVLLLIAATVLLSRSMIRRTRRVEMKVDQDDQEAADAPRPPE